MIRYAIAFAVTLAAVHGPAEARETFAAGNKMLVPPSERPPAEQVLRIEADLASRIDFWSGVRSCARPARARDAFNRAFNRWIGEQVRRRPGATLLAQGWDAGRWWYRNGRRASGARYCRGGFQRQPVWIEFAR